MKSINVVINDLHTDNPTNVEEDVEASWPQIETVDDEGENEDHNEDQIPEPTTARKDPSVRVQKNHPLDLVIGNPDQGITTRRPNEVISNSCFVSLIEPKNVKEALTNEC
jgi:hypothetical protein